MYCATGHGYCHGVVQGSQLMDMGLFISIWNRWRGGTGETHLDGGSLEKEIERILGDSS